MDHRLIFQPVAALTALTFIVWVWLYVTRIGHMRKNRIHAQDLADPVRAEELLKDVTGPSDNFENLFELPVLFYVATIVTAVSGLTDESYVQLAWAFVVLRAVHSFIACSHQIILARFFSYVAGALVLAVYWFRLGIALFSAN